jgi:hypothetical protein
MRLIVSALIVIVSVAASLAIMASESASFLGAHEIPPFVGDRIELVSGRLDRDLAASRAPQRARGFHL